ncbi:MAG: sulfatase-like hydrolase/transferase, partial [Gemmataceae bacterium]
PADKVLRHQRIERPRKYHVEWHELSSEDAETADGVVARQAAAMLDKLKTRGQPFFLAVGFRRPHAPYAAPKKYFDMYPPDKVPPLVEPAEHLTKIPVAALTYPPGTPLLSARQRAENVAAYWACITFVDAQIAHVLEALDRNNLAHNTVLVFYSDHGYHLGEHGGMWHKMSVFEESARVPLIVVAPGTGFASGRACPRIVELLDVYPTLVELCGLPAVNGLQGASLVPLLRNPDAEWQRPAFTQVIHDEVVGRSVRTPRWRYTEWDGGRQGVELYDHDADSHEYVNVANDPQWASVRNELHGLLPADKETPQPAKQ